MKKSIVGIFAFGLLGLVSFGCGGGVANAPASVSGKVTYKGAPVTGGNIGFTTADGMGGGYASDIKADGTYSIKDLAAGDVVVTVETESLNPGTKAAEYTGKTKGPTGAVGGPAPGSKRQMVTSPRPDYAGKKETTYLKIPAKYAKKGTTTLKSTLKPGKNTADFDLVD